MRGRYLHLLFDADNTLFDFDASEEEAITGTMVRFGVEPSPEHKALYHTINGELWTLFDNGGITQEELATERFARLLARLGLEGDAGAWNRAYRASLGSLSILLPGAEELCRRLSGQYTLSLITNGLSDVQRGRLGRSPIQGYFGQRVFISDEMGCRKPEPVYFDKVLDSLDCRGQKDRVLVIGDSLTSDIRGAVDSGLDCVWLNRAGKESPSLRPTYEVRDFSQVEALLL